MTEVEDIGLIDAIKKNDTRAIGKLIEDNANNPKVLFKKDAKGNTALQHLILHLHEKLPESETLNSNLYQVHILRLIELGSAEQVFSPNNSFDTALHRVAEHSNPNDEVSTTIVAELIEKAIAAGRVDLLSTKNLANETPLRLAEMQENHTIADQLRAIPPFFSGAEQTNPPSDEFVVALGLQAK